MKRHLLTIFGLALTFCAHANELETATYTAVTACQFAAEGLSIDDCGNMGGRQPERSVARKAVMRYYQARAAFLGACKASAGQCMHEVIWHTEVGIMAALDPAPGQTRPLPRSDSRR